MAGVSLVNVKKVYPGGVTAVHESSLEIADREFMVLVGPSGCGKTTTLRMIAGLEEITAGAISIGDRVVNDVLPKDRDIAMVFQNYAIYPHMTVYDNMAFGLRQRKAPKEEIDRRVRKAADILDIAGLLDRRPKALSGGQRQRVAVGRAIVREPKVFLFDEPLSNLDAKMRVEMRKELKLLHQRLKTTMIYVTHDQVEAMTLGDRVCVMNAGRIEQVGSPLEVYDRPATRFVAGFIGTPPMNFLPGRLTRQGARARFEGKGFAFALPQDLRADAAALDTPLELGVRPEDLVHDPQAAPESFIPGEVKIIESLGNEQLVYVECGGDMLISRRDAHVRVAPGDPQRLIPRPGKLHLFLPDGCRAGAPQGGKATATATATTAF
jgi:multiple sugar transport system ATP-binding protein